MEEWQCKHITKNLPELISLTKFDGVVKAELESHEVLSQTDIDGLDAVEKQLGKSEASGQYYKLLMGRTGAYKVLTKALMQLRQSGAAKILIRVPTELYSKPLTYLGISTELKSFKDADIEVNGKILKLQQLFPVADYEALKKVFQSCLTELEIYDTFITNERPFVFGSKSVPPKPLYYVPRFLSNRIKIDESIFKAEGSDVFVFKNTIPRYQLSEIVRPHFTTDSTSQLTNITSRFIYLDENEDWSELMKMAKVPIHLVKYETVSEDSSNNKSDRNNTSDYEGKRQDHFVLEDSSAPSDILRKLGSREERVYMTEVEFVQQQLSEDCTSPSVCICDVPGMGKTFLLANIARLMADNCVGRIIVFIQLASFANDFFPGSSNTTLEPKTSLINVLSYICVPGQSVELLLELVTAKLLQLEIFFDGFDEIPTEKVKWTKKVFQSIRKNLPKVRIYITSRPHMRKELEDSLGVVAYDILPFSQKNQVYFLVEFWKKSKPDLDSLHLKTQATKCLKVVNESLTRNEKEIAGTPILCQLIAEVYSDKISTRLLKSNFCGIPLNLSEMYQKFIENKIQVVVEDKKQFDNTKMVHIWHALKLLFPTNGFHEDKQFKTVKGLMTSSKMLRVGILQKHSNGALEFIHRTFAEYIVAEYFFTKLQDRKMSWPFLGLKWFKDKLVKKPENINCNSMSIFELLLKCQNVGVFKYRKYHRKFDHPVIVHFFNSALVQDNFSEKLRMQGAAFVYSISHEEFVAILCACCRKNLVSLFCLLTLELKTWDKSQIQECFGERNLYALLRVCIMESTSQIFEMCIQLLAEVLKVDLEQLQSHYMDDTLLQTAVECANYEAVWYFVERYSLQNQFLLKKCVKCSYGKDDIRKREHILLMLLNKDPSLIHEDPDILNASGIDLRLFKILVNLGANLNAVNEYRNNCATHAAEYMSHTDYHELVQFLLTDFKAEYLFLHNEKWKDPLPNIIKRASLLPETLKLLLNIRGNDINMKDKYGENLLFRAVFGKKVDIFQQLLDRGLDYNERGKKTRSLLHVASQWGGVEMVRYLLSLKLDPNSCDQNGLTPLHFAAQRYSLSVLEVLVENGANVQTKNKWGQTALHISVTVDIPNTEVVKFLITKGAGVNDRDNKGNTPLHLCKNTKVRDCLAEMGADIQAKNKKGQMSAPIDPMWWFEQPITLTKEILELLNTE